MLGVLAWGCIPFISINDQSTILAFPSAASVASTARMNEQELANERGRLNQVGQREQAVGEGQRIRRMARVEQGRC